MTLRSTRPTRPTLVFLRWERRLNDARSGAVPLGQTDVRRLDALLQRDDLATNLTDNELETIRTRAGEMLHSTGLAVDPDVEDWVRAVLCSLIGQPERSQGLPPGDVPDLVRRVLTQGGVRVRLVGYVPPVPVSQQWRPVYHLAGRADLYLSFCQVARHPPVYAFYDWRPVPSWQLDQARSPSPREDRKAR